MPSPVFFREMYVAPNRDAAEQQVRESFERLYQVYHRAGQPGESYDLDFGQLRNERIIVGDPEDAVREIQSYRDEFGADYMFFRVYYLGMDPELSVECIRLFGAGGYPPLRLSGMKVASGCAKMDNPRVVRPHPLRPLSRWERG